MQEILPCVFLVPQDGGKGFGYSHFVVRPAGNLLLDASRVGTLKDSFDAFEARGSATSASTMSCPGPAMARPSSPCRSLRWTRR